MNDNKDSIFRAVYNIAFPTMIQMLLGTSYHIINTIWVGLLGSFSLAGVTSSSFIIWMIFSIVSITEVGVNSLVARYYGAKDNENLNKVSFYGIRLGLIISLIVGLLFLPNLENIFLYIVKLNKDVTSVALTYLIPFICILPLYIISSTCHSIFRGIGDTKTPLKIASFYLTLNALLDPIFIFYFNFGVSGIAIANFISQLFDITACIYILKNRNIINTKFKNFFDFKVFKSISFIGIPIAANGVIFCIVYLFLTRIISTFGHYPIAALGIGHNTESIAYTFSLGFSIAATTLVGQNIGAKDYYRAHKIAINILYYSCTFTLFYCLILFLFNEKIASIFTKEKEVLNYATNYLKVIAFTEVFLAMEIVMEGIFSGKGNTLPPIIIGLPLNILRIPIAYYLSNFYGANGIWVAIGLTTSLKGIILTIWYYLTTENLKTSYQNISKI
ncbi:MAG: MATE family efflux transporter [Candidatus Sericytochromatia bacterium]|nr:MAG: MATE family efflux transporter [Candidatus Sericytochromatia bacterium]